MFAYQETVREFFNNYYINPSIWFSLNYQEKKLLLADCMNISIIKAVLNDEDFDKQRVSGLQLIYYLGTTIKNSDSGETLAGMKHGEIFVTSSPSYHINNVSKTKKSYQKPINTFEVDEYFKKLKIAEELFIDNTDKLPSKNNDSNFKKFLFTYWNIIDDINNANGGLSELLFKDANNTDDFSGWSSRAKNLAKYYKENNVDVTFDEGYFLAGVNCKYLTSFYNYLTPQYKKWLNFEGKIQTEIGLQDSCHSTLYKIVEEGIDYYK